MRDTYMNKHELVNDLNSVLIKWFPDVESVEYYALGKPDMKDGIPAYYSEEFIILKWKGGGKSYANNSCNSLSATAKTVMSMLNGGYYQNVEYYESILESEEWFSLV